VLAVSALTALGVAGCGQIRPWSTPPKPAPDVRVLTDAIAAEHSMITVYQSVILGFPVLGQAITPLLRQHEEHLAWLRGRLVVPAGARPGPAPSARGSTSPAAGHRPAPSTAAAAIAYLRAAERDQAAALVRHLPAVTPSLAQLLASIGASEASHAALLSSAGQRE
jgi:hypothetical protein